MNFCGSEWRNVRESDMISEMQIHTIARQMIEKHGFEASRLADPAMPWLARARARPMKPRSGVTSRTP